MNISPLNIYYLFILILAVGRIIELKHAQNNTKKLIAKGAREYGSNHYKWIVLTHTFWLIACVIEAYIHQHGPSIFVFAFGCLLFAAGFSLRITAILTLGARWTTKVIVLPGEPSIQKSIYRYIKHPNYLGVILELAGVPLIFGNIWTAVTISIINLIILKHRMKIEENALKQEIKYEEHFSDLPRLIPKI